MNGQFEFRLEKVLKYREDREKAAQKSFAVAAEAWHESRRELTELKDRLSETADYQAGCNHGGLDLDNLILISRFAHYLTGMIKNQETTVREKEDDVNRERVCLESEMRDRKMLHRLKEKALYRHEQSSKLDEQKQNDEFAVMGFGRGEA